MQQRWALESKYGIIVLCINSSLYKFFFLILQVIQTAKKTRNAYYTPHPPQKTNQKTTFSYE